MIIFIYGMPILLGFVLGNYLALPPLILITLVCAGIGIYLARTMKELAKMFTVMFAFCALLGNIVMWVTYYTSTQQSWIGDLLRGYILR